VAGLSWLVSLVRVVVPLVKHEVFGAQAWLAVLCVAAVPLVLAPRLEALASMRVR